MSQQEPTDTPEDAEDTEETIELADPDDYHRTQRLKEIHQARQHTHDVIKQFERAKYRKVNRDQRRELAYAVSMYVSELEPLLFDIDADISLPEHWPWDNILTFADTLGVVPNDYDDDRDYAPRPNSIQVYRQCNRILADVKPLIEDDDTDEWEV